MLEFLSSLSVLGWLLIALACATVWQIKPIMEMIFYRSREGRWPIPGEEPPQARGTGQPTSRGSQNETANDHDDVGCGS